MNSPLLRVPDRAGHTPPAVPPPARRPPTAASSSDSLDSLGPPSHASGLRRPGMVTPAAPRTAPRPTGSRAAAADDSVAPEGVDSLQATETSADPQRRGRSQRGGRGGAASSAFDVGHVSGGARERRQRDVAAIDVSSAGARTDDGRDNGTTERTAGDDDDDDVQSVDMAEDEDVLLTWSTRLFRDAFSDMGVAAEILLCHPCNVSAQLNAAMAPDPDPPSPNGDDEDSAALSSAASDDSAGHAGLRRRQAAVRASQGQQRYGSSTGTTTSTDSDGGGVSDGDRLASMRAALPPLDVVPCIGVVVLNVMCFGAGSMYFSYWIRNELAHRFNLVPDVGHLPTDDIYVGPDSSPAGSRASSRSPPRIGRRVARPPPSSTLGGDDDNGDGDGTSPGRRSRLFDRDAVRQRAHQAAGVARDKAKRAAKKTEKVMRTKARQYARTSAEYLHSTVYSAFCWPCAMCQTMRELELRGFRPVRYLSATRLAATYSTAMLTGQPRLAARMQ